MRWNVHPRLADTVELVQSVQAKTVVPAFCDRSYLARLAAALAPAQGFEIRIDDVFGIRDDRVEIAEAAHVAFRCGAEGADREQVVRRH